MTKCLSSIRCNFMTLMSCFIGWWFMFYSSFRLQDPKKLLETVESMFAALLQNLFKRWRKNSSNLVYKFFTISLLTISMFYKCIPKLWVLPGKLVAVINMSDEINLAFILLDGLYDLTFLKWMPLLLRLLQKKENHLPSNITICSDS